MTAEQDFVGKLNCANYAQSKYKKGWNKVCVRLGDNPELLFDSTKKQLHTTKIFRKNFQYILKDNSNNENIKSQPSHKISLAEQFAELVVNYDKDRKHSEILISINQMNTTESAFEHFLDTCHIFGIRSRPSFLAFPNEKFFTDAIQQYKTNIETKNLEIKFSDDTIKQLAKNSDYFFAHNDWIPNLALLYKNNICVLIQDISSTANITNREHLNNTRPNLEEILTLADFTGRFFEEIPDKNVTLKDASIEQLLLTVVENNINESGKCVVSWRLTSDEKLSLYGVWVRCDVDKGTLEINEPVPDIIKRTIEENTTKLNHPDDEGKITISNIPSTGCTLTAYAITVDGKTWYKRQIKIDPKKQLLPSINYPYRHWESLDGRYEIEARLISVDIDDKDGKKYVTLERQDNARKTKIPLDQISKPDQKYIQEQIDKQEDNNTKQ